MIAIILTLCSELDPPVRELVNGTSFRYYAFEDINVNPVNSLASWQDGKRYFYLIYRNASSPPVPDPALETRVQGRFYAAGTGCGV